RLFPGAADNERRDEIAEGLPSYTEVAAWANSPADAHRAAVPPASIDVSIVGAFAYTSGRAYGVLLDDLLPGWRRQVRATSDLGVMLTAENNRPLTANLFRGSGALRCGNAANGGGGARSRAAGPRRRVASTLC